MWLRDWVAGAAEALSSDDFPTALTSLFQMAFAGVAIWVAVTLLVSIFNLGWAIKISPPLLRGLLLAALGTALIAPAHAKGTGIDALDGLQLPDRPHASVATAAAELTKLRTETREHSGKGYLVRPGDSLWAIAQSRLPDNATAAEIQNAVNKWHAKNLNVIGPNPDLIYPGQLLKEPKS